MYGNKSLKNMWFLKRSVLWNIALCIPLKVIRYFGGEIFHHLQGRQIIQSFKTIWKEWVVVYLRYFPRMFMEGLKEIQKNSVTIPGFLAEIRTQRFSQYKSAALLLALILVIIFLRSALWRCMDEWEHSSTHLNTRQMRTFSVSLGPLCPGAHCIEG